MVRTLKLTWSLATIGIWLHAPDSLAQEAGVTAPSVTRVAAPADIVRLKNGGLVRGTITELTPGDSVTILTLGGETKKFSAADVVYAGAVSSDPLAQSSSRSPAPSAPSTAVRSGAEPYVTLQAPRARVHLASSPRGLIFQRQSAAMVTGSGGTGASGYLRLCAAPCDIVLPAGRETIRIAGTDGAELERKIVDFPAGSSELRATLEDNHRKRLFGWAALGVGVIGGAALVFTGLKMRGDHETAGKIAADSGLLLGLAGIGVGIAFVVQSDSVAIEQRRTIGSGTGGTRFAVVSVGLRKGF